MMIKINNLRLLYVFAYGILFSAGNLYSQTNDLQLWTNISLEKKITKTFSLNYAEEVRFNENISEVGQFFSDLGCNYKISKSWRISVNYRYTNKKKLDDSYSKRNRYYIDLSYRKKFDKVICVFRTRFQSQYVDVYSSSIGRIPEYYSRNKLTFKIDLDKKFAPYLSIEMFYQLHNPEGNDIDNMRYTGGVEYQFNKKASLDIFYMIQQEYNVKRPERDYVIGIGYSISL